MNNEEKGIFCCHRVWVPTTRSIINGKLYQIFGIKFVRFFNLKPHYKWRYFNYTILGPYFEGKWHETLFNSSYRKKVK